MTSHRHHRDASTNCFGRRFKWHLWSKILRRSLRYEVLEDRRMLSLGAPQVELFDVSPALEEGYGITGDGAGSMYVTGMTESPDFPGRLNAQQGGRDAFVATITPSEWAMCLSGVSQIALPNSNPGPVYDMSGDWTPLVGGDADSTFPSTFVLARPYNQGRVVAFGHNGIFGAVNTLDNGIFLENVTRWLSTSGNRQVRYTTGHGEVVRDGEVAGLAARLAGEGYSFTALPGAITAAELATTSVLIVGNAGQDFSAVEIEAVRQFVAAGGGLWLLGLGWAWEAYHQSATMEDYPMTKIAAPYQVCWLRSVISDPTNSLNGTPVFHTFYPDVPSLTVPDALVTIRAIHAAHPADLPAALESDDALRLAFTQSHQALSIPVAEFPEGHTSRQQVYNALVSLAADFPESYAKTAAFDQVAYPTATWIRERFWRTWRDCLPLTTDVVATLIGTGRLGGGYATVLQRHGVVLLDNLRLGAIQVDFIDRYLDALPATLHNLRSISVVDYLGTQPPAFGLDGQPGAVNVFGLAVGEATENPFPSDVTPVTADIFVSIVAHEVNHAVDAYTIRGSVALDARRDQLVVDAGVEPLNYLRSMIAAGFFTENPQEFFASISNQWFADSARVIELGLARFDAGRRDPINQALFFAEVYSQGGNTTQLYRIGRDGSIIQEVAALGRDNQGHINQLAVGATFYCFTLDAMGDVTAYTVEDRRLLSVGDFVWNDLNANGIQDVGEPGVAGAVVEVFSSPDSVIGNADDIFYGNAITDANGHYQLGSLRAGINYYLVFRTPAGYTFTMAHSNIGDALDSDANASGVTPMFRLASNQDNFTLDAGLVNGAPTDINFSGSSVAENQTAGTVVGTFSTVDSEAPAAPFTYLLVTGTGGDDNVLFTIVGNQLQTATMFDYETKNSYTIRVRSTDQGGLFTEKQFAISILDVDEVPPTVTGTSPSFAISGTLEAGTTSLTIQFSEAVLGGAMTGNYQLQSLGPDALLGTTDDTILPLSVSYAGTAATLRFPALPESVYRLTVRDTITDNAGNSLDGDRNGMPGGDLREDFVAASPPASVFNTTVTYASGGKHSFAIAMGDFNGDGKSDLVVVNGDNVGILLGNGAGGFATAVTYTSSGLLPTAVASGDFNSDGKLDLAVANYYSNNVGILLGDGAGAFLAAVTYGSGGYYPRAVTVGDFNSDGKIDIAVTNESSYTVGILLGDGTGGFAAAVSYGSGGYNPYAVTVGDFNGDGKSDLAVANRDSDNVGVLFGNGTGGFAAAVTYASGGSGPSSIIVVDLNTDGKRDLAVTNLRTNNVGVLLGNGTGGFAAAITYASGGSAPMSVTVGDFNADGRSDLAVANSDANSKSVGVLLGNGIGGFSTAVTYASGGVNPTSVITGDFNADGKRDLVVSNCDSYSDSNNVGVLLNAGQYGPGVRAFDSPHAIRFGVQTRGFGSGQLVGGMGNVFNGVGRLELADQSYAPTLVADFLADGDHTVITPTVTIAGLYASREITVPNTGNEDFSRTVEVFSNPTASAITTTVRIVGNLGSDATTTVWKTSDGDTDLETTDQWIGTDDADGAGTPAIIHYIHGPRGLQPTAVKVTGDNIEWTYDITVPAGETVRLATFTILADTRVQAEAAAEVLVTTEGFGGQAAAFLGQDELTSIANFGFNHVPVLNNVPNSATLAEQVAYGFVATASDQDVPTQTLTFSVQDAPAGAMINASTGVFNWTPNESQGPGTYSFSVVVSDGVTSFSQAVTLTVNEVNVAPVLAAIGNQSVDELTALTLTVSATDADAPVQTLTYSATLARPGVLLVDEDFSAFDTATVWVPSYGIGGDYGPAGVVSYAGPSDTVTIGSVDGRSVAILDSTMGRMEQKGYWTSQTFSGLSDVRAELTFSPREFGVGAARAIDGEVMLRIVNPATGDGVWIEIFGGNSGETRTVHSGWQSGDESGFGFPGDWQYDAWYRLVINVGADETTLGMLDDFTGTPLFTSEVYPIGLSELGPFTLALLQRMGGPVDAPRETVVAMDQLSLTGTADLVTGLPGGANFDPVTGQFSWTPSEDQGPGTYDVTFAVSDGSLTNSETITITVDEVNVAPVLAAITDKTVAQLTALTFTASASDADIPANTLTYSLDAASLAAGMTINGMTGQFSWTPTEDRGPGTYNVTVTVTDNGTPVLSDAGTLMIVLAVTWQNLHHPCDVTGEGYISPLDVLTLINDINANGSRQLAGTTPPTPIPPPFLDPSGDGSISPLDVLILITYLNTYGPGPIPGTSVPPGRGGEGVLAGDGEVGPVSPSTSLVAANRDAALLAVTDG